MDRKVRGGRIAVNSLNNRPVNIATGSSKNSPKMTPLFPLQR